MKILQGVRILDFTWMLAGPYCTRLLADFGAEVIKIQSKKTASGAEDNLSGYFNAWNRNKRSITLDLNFPEARGLVKRLVSLSDVVIENFSPRVMKNWGLDYDALKKIKPGLIMASISAMGQTGPWKDFVGFGPTVQALSGITHLTSFAGGEPLGLGHSYADTVAGLYAALTILAALNHKDATGQGRHVDISAYEAMCSFLGPSILETLATQGDVPPGGNRPVHEQAAPHGVYKCRGKDRWCAISVQGQAEWRPFCRAVGSPKWCGDKKFSSHEGRTEHAAELNGLIEKWTKRRSPQKAVEILQQAGIAAGVVQSAQDLAHDPHLSARGFFLELDHPVLRKAFADRQPIRIEEHPPVDWQAAPLLGEANEYVFKELLGLSESEYSRHVEKGVIG